MAPSVRPSIFDACFTGESKVEQVPVSSPPPSSPASVTTQPTPRADPFPPAAPPAPRRPPTPPPPEPAPPLPCPSTEEEAEAQATSDPTHRTPKKDLLEIDRFTICGNRID